jgi:hypothetical protein
MPARFPYIAIASTGGESYVAPILPLELRFKDNEPIQVHGLLDSGATVNVLPYNLGLRLGAIWDAQTTRVTLSGNLAAHEARALLLHAKVADFAPVPLALRGLAQRACRCCLAR